MKILLKVFLVIGTLWAANWLFLHFLSPSGVWIRREVREHPLAHPLKVTQIDGLSLVADGRRFMIGGVALPKSQDSLALLAEFLRVATAQGIEIDATAGLPSGHSVRCEPRVWHWCGNDPVAAHYQQLNLNEMIIALGYADLGPELQDATTPAGLRLRAAAKFAHDYQGSKDRWKNLKHGIDVSVTSVDAAIQAYAYDLETAHQ